MNETVKYITGSFLWSSLANVLNAGSKFVTIPLLLSHYGKEQYGLIALAVSINAYMQLMNMGMNTGAVTYFSQWLGQKEYARIDRVARSNLSVYGGLGLLNSLILLLLAWRSGTLFHLSPESTVDFRSLLYILAGFSVVNWTSLVFNQLLVADERIAFTQRVLSLRNVLNLMSVFLAIHLRWTLVEYFLMDSLVNTLIVVPYYWQCKRRKLIRSLLPAFYREDFYPVFKYSLALFAMSLFQYSATHSRPLILGIFSTEGASVLADYRVIEVFPVFIITIGGMMVSILLPKSSKAVEQNNRTAIEQIAYQGTRYTSILVAMLCVPILLNAKELLDLFVGAEYTHLSSWLMLWVFTLTLYLHNSPISSLVLATGKTRMLVYSSAVSCVVSMLINALLAPKYGVGSAVIGDRKSVV